MSSNDEERRHCPYVGLQPYEEADREFFFGRERDQRIIISNLMTSPLTILYGASGVGKSSVLMAGVIPQLRRERPKTPVVMFRSWADKEFHSTLTRACIEAVWEHDVRQPKPAESLPFDEILRACAEAAHETILVILDQFEEYFLYHPKSSDPSSFEAQFARAVNREDVDVGFLIAMREDGLSKLDRFQERIPNLLSNRLWLEHLDEAGAAVAIRRPLDVWNDRQGAESPPIGIEDELVGELIQQVRIGEVSTGRHGGSGAALSQGEGHVEAPFLQLVMVRLWNEERRAGSNALRRETLDRLKGAKEIVRTHLDDVMSRLDPASQAVCASFFDRLVTPTGTKVACYAADLASWAEDLAPRVPAVLELLSRDRILRTVAAAPDKPEATRYEIYHDVLAPAILEWRRRFVELQERSRAVAHAREQAARRALRRWLGVLATMTVIAVVGWLVAWWEGRRSEANQKAAEAIYTAPFDAQRGLDLALEAVETTSPFGMSAIRASELGMPPTLAAEDALRQAIQASRLQWTLRIGTLASDVALTPDGKKLATAGQDGNVKIWDISTGYPEPTQLTFQHRDWVREVAFLPTGDRLLTVAEDTAYLWALDRPEAQLHSFPHGSPIYGAFAVSRDGRRLATAGNGSRQGRFIKVWDLADPGEDPQPMVTIDVGGAWVMGLAFSPDGCCLATACVERGGAERTSTSLWSVESGRELLRVPNKAASDSVAFSPDGEALVTASRDSYVRIWRPTGITLNTLMKEFPSSTGPEKKSSSDGFPEVRWSEQVLAGHGERVRNIDISPDGRRIASASGDQTAKIWNFETGENLLTLIGHEGYVEAVKISADGHHVATASRDRTVKFWNIEGHTSAVTGIAFSPDGKWLATGSSDRTAKIWDVSTVSPRLKNTLRGHTDQICRLAFNAQGTRLATAGFDNSVKLWDVSSGAEIITLKKHRDQLRSVAFSPDGRYLASAGADGDTWLFDLQSPDIQGTALHWPHNEKQASTQASVLAFHPRQDRWVTGGSDGKLQLWDVTGKKIGTIDLAQLELQGAKRLTDITFSPDGKLIAALARRWVHFWPVETFEHPQTRPSSSITVQGAGFCGALAYSHDGSQLAVGCNDASVRIYDTAGNMLVKTITVHKNAVSDVAFSPDGSKLATASLDKTFHVSPLRFDELYETARRLQRATTGSGP